MRFSHGVLSLFAVTSAATTTNADRRSAAAASNILEDEEVVYEDHRSVLLRWISGAEPRTAHHGDGPSRQISKGMRSRKKSEATTSVGDDSTTTIIAAPAGTVTNDDEDENKADDGILSLLPLAADGKSTQLTNNNADFLVSTTTSSVSTAVVAPPISKKMFGAVVTGDHDLSSVPTAGDEKNKQHEPDAGILSRPHGFVVRRGSPVRTNMSSSSSTMTSRALGIFLLQSDETTTTTAPTTSGTTASPSIASTTASPSIAPTSSSPSIAPTTASPTIAPTSAKPSMSPTAIPTYSLQCPAGYVDCVNGYMRTNNSISCNTACEGKCCTGTDACTDFTGKICKDDSSCKSTKACYSASIPLVVKSCNGKYACYYAEKVLKTVNSCNGNGACFYVGLYSPDSTARAIRDSCNGYYACASAAYKGNIGNITSSCNAKYACYVAGSSPPNGTGPITSILSSCCNGESECDYTNEQSIPALCFSSTQVRIWH